MPRDSKIMSISESEIEDALVGNLDLLAKYFGDSELPKLIDRQLHLDGGEKRLDLLLARGKRLALVELKATAFADQHLRQTLDYRLRLQKMQIAGKLMSGEIDAYLFVTAAPAAKIRAAKAAGVQTVIYDPLEIMRAYFQRMSKLSPFLEIKAKDHGIYSIARLIPPMIKMSEGVTLREEIAKQLNMRDISAYHLLTGCQEFGLARSSGRHWFLTDFGNEFIAAKESTPSAKKLSPLQKEKIRLFISKHPFYSSSVFGIYAIVECAFLLSRNSYPIEIDGLKNNFLMVSGKLNEWRGPAINRRTLSFLRFAIELDLLGRIGSKAVITPAGFRFILTMQLHKGIEMIEGLSFHDNS